MKVLAIAPYPGLKELLLSIGEEQPFELWVETGDLTAGLYYAEEAEKNGTDIIISRGGTAELIQEKVSIPVIEIEVSGYDMLRVITLIKDFPGKAAIVGFAAIAEGAAAICSLVDIDIKSITITEAQEVYSRLEELQTKGFQVIIGDVITVKIAEELGLNGILLTSGKESVIKAFNEARKSYNIIENLKSQYGITDDVLRNFQQSVLVFNQNKKLMYCNHKNHTFLEGKINDYFGDIYHAIDRVREKAFLEFLYEDGHFVWKMKGELINKESECYVVFFIEKNEKIQTIGGLTINFNQNRTGGPSTALKGTLSENPKMNKLYEKALHFTKSTKNILIEGERGTGKERTAELIHLNSERHQHPFVTIDCEIINIEDLQYICKNLTNENRFMSFLNEGTLFLKSVHYLSSASQQLLLDGLNLNSDIRMISSSSKELRYLIQDKFLSSFYEKIAEFVLYLPPLRERKEDIESLSRLFINESNIRYGKQVSGIREKGLMVLQTYKWHGNISELYRVIEEAVLISNNSYLEEEDINNVLIHDWEKEELELSGTLNEIETRVIKEVLKQEDFNHSKTAKRLGINRTTLWRKLKQENM